MSKSKEKKLDQALEKAFTTYPNFTKWFLDQTKFSDTEASYLWSRSNHPWGRCKITLTDPNTGIKQTVLKEGETDLLVVFETNDGNRFALHIENKLAKGNFTPLQPELYASRGTSWENKPKYKNYKDFETVLVAPTSFYKRNLIEVKKFDRYISHEAIGKFLKEEIRNLDAIFAAIP